jgi:hypothetical protein
MDTEWARIIKLIHNIMFVRIGNFTSLLKRIFVSTSSNVAVISQSV